MPTSELDDEVRRALPLKHREFLMLLALVGGRSHGYALKQEVHRRTDGRVNLGPGTLYRTLRSLEESGLIAETTERPADDDPRRRYYAITELGRRVAAAEARRLESLVSEARTGRLIS